jgi:4a-hydroxytetrahydrobiopterin dehydratase
MNTTELITKSCQACSETTPALKPSEIDALLRQLQGWQQYDHLISKTYRFKNYYQTMAFVNAIAWLSHCEDHHATLGVSYKECRVEFTTHTIHGLSENDFICAAKIDALHQI